ARAARAGKGGPSGGERAIPGAATPGPKVVPASRRGGYPARRGDRPPTGDGARRDRARPGLYPARGGSTDPRRRPTVERARLPRGTARVCGHRGALPQPRTRALRGPRPARGAGFLPALPERTAPRPRPRLPP